jgi:hypothetical protein
MKSSVVALRTPSAGSLKMLAGWAAAAEETGNQPADVDAWLMDPSGRVSAV